MNNKKAIYVDPNFKTKLVTEAKIKGMTIGKFTEELAKDKSRITEIAESWDKKLKRIPTKKRRGFDFV